MSILTSFWKLEACGQIVLPLENAKLENYKCDFLGDFQTLWKMSQLSFFRMLWSFDIWSILNQTLCFFQLIGCMIIGYMAWVLSTSVTVSRFLDGTLVRYPNDHMSCHIICWNICIFQIFTYVVIGLGFTLFFSGLIGWVGGASESPCLVRLFLFSVVVSMIAEIGGIISLNIVRLEVQTQC